MALLDDDGSANRLRLGDAVLYGGPGPDGARVRDCFFPLGEIEIAQLRSGALIWIDEAPARSAYALRRVTGLTHLAGRTYVVLYDAGTLRWPDTRGVYKLGRPAEFVALMRRNPALAVRRAAAAA